MTRTCSLTAVALILTFALACDDTAKDSDSGPTATTTSGTGTGSATGTATGTGTGTGGTVDTCSELCSEADTAGVAEGACVSQELQGLGYDVIGAPYECAAIAGNPVGCQACMATLGVSDSDCAAVYQTCL